MCALVGQLLLLTGRNGHVLADAVDTWEDVPMGRGIVVLHDGRTPWWSESARAHRATCAARTFRIALRALVSCAEGPRGM